MAQPTASILAGPNGSGKSTFARGEFAGLVEQGRFLNADEVARAISPTDPEGSAISAGRAVLARRQELIRKRVPFAVETTLASQTLLRGVHEWRVAGYRTELIYLFVSDPDICIERVAQRVALGGHFIPAEVVVRRYHLGLRLLPHYLSTVDAARIYAADSEPKMVASKEAGEVRIEDHSLWRTIFPLLDPLP